MRGLTIGRSIQRLEPTAEELELEALERQRHADAAAASAAAQAAAFPTPVIQAAPEPTVYERRIARLAAVRAEALEIVAANAGTATTLAYGVLNLSDLLLELLDEMKEGTRP